MIEAIKRILDKIGCRHEWQLFREIPVDTNGGCYHKFIFICKKCGKFKKFKSNPG